MDEKNLTPGVEEKETPTDSSPENNQPSTPDSSQDNKDANNNVPWDKDPRWIAWQQEKDSLKAQVDELLPLKDLAQRFSPKEETKVPSWFGGDEAQWQAFSGYLDSQSDAKAKAAVEAYKAEQAQQSQAITEATKWIEESVSKIETDKAINPTGKKLSESDRNELLKFTYDNYLIDPNGRWDYAKAYKFMNVGKDTSGDLSERKRLAGLTNSDSKAETPPSDVKTTQDFKGGNRPW